jgi:hypothetical protein
MFNKHPVSQWRVYWLQKGRNLKFLALVFVTPQSAVPTTKCNQGTVLTKWYVTTRGLSLLRRKGHFCLQVYRFGRILYQSAIQIRGGARHDGNLQHVHKVVDTGRFVCLDKAVLWHTRTHTHTHTHKDVFESWHSETSSLKSRPADPLLLQRCLSLFSVHLYKITTYSLTFRGYLLLFRS